MVAQRDLDIILSTAAQWEKLKDKNVLVTGASGRLGIYIAQALMEANRRLGLGMQIFLLARSREKLEHSFGRLLSDPGIHILLQDIQLPLGEVTEKVHYIFHTAGLASPSDFTYRPIETMWGHIQGTKNVLDFAVSHGTEKVLYVSTVEIYGSWDTEAGIREDDMGPMDCTVARACYPESKRMCETMLACYRQEHNLEYVTVRLSHTLGPGISLDDGRAFAEFLRCALHGEDIVLQSDGSAIRTYTYVADAVGAMFLALLNGGERAYNIAAVRNQISVRDLAELIAAFSVAGQTKVRYACKEGTQLAYLPFRLGIMDCTRIEQLGWKPQVDIDHLFRWTFDALAQQL